MTIEQVTKVRKVKRRVRMIIDPVTLPLTLLWQTQNAMSEYGPGIPIVDENQKLKGIVTTLRLTFRKKTMQEPRGDD
jgi:CBS domain-containing protein